MTTRRLNYLRRVVKIQETALPYLEKGIPINRVWKDHIFERYDTSLDTFMRMLRDNVKGELSRAGYDWRAIIKQE